MRKTSMMMSFAVFVVLSLVGGLWAAPVASAADDEIVIGFSNWSKRFVFYQELERGILDAAAENGVRVIVSDPNGDQATQQAQVENFITQGVDGMIIIPVDSRAVVPTVLTANDANVPVVTADISAAGGDVVSHIASDNRLGGSLAAERLSEVLGGEGKVAVITYPVISTTIEREEAFLEAIKDYPGIEVVATQSGQSQRDQAMSVTENFLQRYPDLDGIFAVNDMQGLGALAAVEAAGKGDQVAIVGFDAEPEAVAAMEAGSAYKGSVAQQPYLIGKTAVETLLKHLNGDEVADAIPVPVTMVTGADE